MQSIKKRPVVRPFSVPFLMQISLIKNENASDKKSAKNWSKIRCCISVV